MPWYTVMQACSSLHTFLLVNILFIASNHLACESPEIGLRMLPNLDDFLLNIAGVGKAKEEMSC